MSSSSIQTEEDGCSSVVISNTVAFCLYSGGVLIQKKPPDMGAPSKPKYLHTTTTPSNIHKVLHQQRTPYTPSLPKGYTSASTTPSLPSIPPLLEMADYMTTPLNSFPPYEGANRFRPALRRYTVQTSGVSSQIEDLSATLQIPENQSMNSAKLRSVYIRPRRP